MHNYKDIYNHLGDELSREIFGYRALYSETGDYYWIRKLLYSFPEGTNFLKKLESGNRRRVIFCAGVLGQDLKLMFPKGWECFVDNFHYGMKCLDLPVISFEDYLNFYSDADVYVASSIYNKEIVSQLSKAGIPPERIVDLNEYNMLLEDKQYFDLPYLYKEAEEVFVDCGCFNGATSKNFIKWCNHQYSHIYAFETEADKIGICKEALPNDKTDIYNLGLSDKAGKLRFTGNLQGASHVSEDGKQTIIVDSLDNVLKEKGRVSFIKMDIEGQEMAALRGAKNIIQQNHPKLAISIYHRPTDIYEIPSLLLEYNPEYVFYLRHYTMVNYDTVLYAIESKKA